jgi:hypothetical protein
VPGDPARLFRFAYGQNPGALGLADLANAFACALTTANPQAGVVLMQAATALVELALGKDGVDASAAATIKGRVARLLAILIFKIRL